MRSPSIAVGTVYLSLQPSENSEGNRLQIDDPPTGTIVVIQMGRVADSQVHCKVRVGETVFDVGRRVPMSTWPRTGYVSLFARSMALSVLWTTIYSQ